jgi:hypothetical protein
MELNEALAKNQKAILTLWIERTLDSYTSPDFFKKSKDRFANPVGAAIRDGFTRVFELLLQGAEQHAFLPPLDQVVRMRAVQDFTPGQALAPILELKWVVRQVLSKDEACKGLLTTLDLFDCEVDRLALSAFNLYSDCRELLYQNRIRELKSGSYLLTDSACPSALARTAGSESPTS